ncbi:MAG: hypothetical protein ACK47B_23835 [Armatimonadota bacterium]
MRSTRLYWAGGLAAALLVVGLVGAGCLSDALGPPAPAKTAELQVAEVGKTVMKSELETQLVAAVQQLAEQVRTQDSRLTAQETRKADVATRTVERIERYLPSPPPVSQPIATGPPASAPAPVVIVRDSPPAPVPVSISATPVEVVTRTIESVDRSTSETARASESRTDERTVASSESQAQETTTQVATAETSTRTTVESRTEERPAEPERAPPLGLALTSQLQPALTYDLASASLGPRAFGLGRLGAGLFVTKSGDGLDGGPQVNLRPGKGRLFLGAGYAVRERSPLLMAGFSF